MVDILSNARGKIIFRIYLGHQSKKLSDSYYLCIMGGSTQVDIGAFSPPTFHIYIIKNAIFCTTQKALFPTGLLAQTLRAYAREIQQSSDEKLGTD